MAISGQLLGQKHHIKRQHVRVVYSASGERSEPVLKRKRLSQLRKERKPLGAPTRRSPSPVSRSGLDSLRSERRFLLRGGSFSLSNSVQCSDKHRNDRQNKPGDAEKAGRRRRH